MQTWSVDARMIKRFVSQEADMHPTKTMHNHQEYCILISYSDYGRCFLIVIMVNCFGFLTIEAWKTRTEAGDQSIVTNFCFKLVF